MLSIPTNNYELERLASLYLLNILNVTRDEQLEQFTLAGAQLFDAPIALLSLAGEYQQWVSTRFGVESSEIPAPRKSIFCTQANSTLVIPDTLRDPQFTGNPLVTGVPYIRFYIGQPLLSITGQRLGTLCIIDHRPRWPGSEQLAALQVVATRINYHLVNN